jgi:hypothetical protein
VAWLASIEARLYGEHSSRPATTPVPSSNATNVQTVNVNVTQCRCVRDTASTE